MKKFYEIGVVLFDYMALTLILLISGFLILPLYSVFVGIIGFYQGEETYKRLYLTIKENYKKIFQLTVMLVILVAGMIVFFNYMNHYVVASMIIYGLFGYISLLILVYAPVIMIHMKVSLKQLFHNMFVLSIVKFPYTLVMFGVMIFMVYLLVNDVLWFIILIMMAIRSISFLSHKALMSLSDLDTKKEVFKKEKNDEKII